MGFLFSSPLRKIYKKIKFQIYYSTSFLTTPSTLHSRREYGNHVMGNKDPSITTFLIIKSHVFPLTKAVTSIGRSLNSDLVLHDPSISRNHAEIRIENEKYYLYDLKSSSGSYINNRSIERGELFSGDLITLANFPLMFVSEDGDESKKLQATTDNLKE